VLGIWRIYNYLRVYAPAFTLLQVNQKVVLKVLQHIAGGCQPDVVENGLEVLKAVERKHYDLLLLDIHVSTH
jgi:CheY-like chemotaxis protein